MLIVGLKRPHHRATGGGSSGRGPPPLRDDGPYGEERLRPRSRGREGLIPSHRRWGFGPKTYRGPLRPSPPIVTYHCLGEAMGRRRHRGSGAGESSRVSIRFRGGGRSGSGRHSARKRRQVLPRTRAPTRNCRDAE